MPNTKSFKRKAKQQNWSRTTEKNKPQRCSTENGLVLDQVAENVLVKIVS